jgi:hypothetical protein
LFGANVGVSGFMRKGLIEERNDAEKKQKHIDHSHSQAMNNENNNEKRNDCRSMAAYPCLLCVPFVTGELKQ